MKVIYGIPKDDTERHTETLLCDIAETENDVEAVKEAASREGYHSFRVANYDPQVFEKPDFIGTINKNIMRKIK